MNQIVRAGRFGGSVRAIASKSCAHRLLICAALSETPSHIACASVSEDILATVSCLNALGADIARTADGFSVRPLRPGARQTAVLDAGESGSTLRFLLPVVSALGIPCEIRMHGRLPERPLSPLREVLIAHGAALSPPGSNPLCCGGRLTGHTFSLPADISSQFLSGMLLALPLLGGGQLQMTGRLESAGYLDLTVDAMRRCGIQVAREGDCFTVAGSYRAPDMLTVEGDWSNAAVWLCAGAIGPAPVTVTGLNLQSAQGDRAVAALLARFGAAVGQSAPDALTVAPAPLHACEINASNTPDLVPALAVVACAAAGETRITGAARLRIKESDRLQATCAVLTALSADIAETPDGLVIRGGRPLHGGTVDSWNDHRIAMAAALAALLSDGPVTITDALAVQKSYPAFFADFAALGGETEETP